ncbi:MAG: DUF4340 domain-containing protein [Proteobacteria bacterium]|nr:DUF4340 domain-containing protein [Pseudomonadota bacterium]
MKIKKEYIILFVVIVVLATYLTIDQSDRTHYQLPVIPDISQADVTKLLISDNDYKIELVKKANTWLVQPENYLADSSKMKTMLNAIEKITLTALVSESETYERYDLGDDKKINVTAWAGESEKRKFDIGKTASSNQHTFIRLDADNRIFHARGNLRSAFDLTIEQLRDKSVLTFEKDGIKEITVSENGESMMLSLKETEAANEKPDEIKDKEKKDAVSSEKKIERTWMDPDGKPLDESKISGLISVVSNLKCESYIDRKTKADFKDMKALYTVQLDGEKTYSLTIFNKETESAKSYPGISSENDYPFVLPEWKVDSIKTNIEDLNKKKSDTDK